MADQDHGHGDVTKFSAEDLERLYRKGGLDVAAQIQGASLNKILGVRTYDPEAWYMVTEKGVERLG